MLAKNKEPSIGYSIAYPFGVIGAILRIYFMTRIVRPKLPPKSQRLHVGEIPMGLFIKAGAPDSFRKSVNRTAADFPDLTLEQFHLQPHAGYGREHPRRLSHGRRRLLVCVPAEENGRATPLSRERLRDALLRRLRVGIKRRRARLLLRKSGSLDSKELGDAP
jgi:hypothetical protein